MHAAVRRREPATHEKPDRKEQEETMRNVIALFEDLAEARRTSKDLAQSGLSLDQISVVSPETAPTSGTVDLPLDTMNVAGVGEVAACGPMIEYMRSAAATEPGTLADVLVRMGL